MGISLSGKSLKSYRKKKVSIPDSDQIYKEKKRKNGKKKSSIAKFGLKSNQKRYLKAQKEYGRCMVMCICKSPSRKASDCKGPIRKLKRVNYPLRKKGSSNSTSDKEN